MFTQIKSIHIFIIFVVVALIQISVPAKMIYNQEDILKTGTVFKFKTQPLDPADPFKGKYIRLDYEINSFPTKDSTWTRDEVVYVTLINDSNGYAKLSSISREKPNAKNYLKTNVDWFNEWEDKVFLDYNFERFYMKETKAKAAEIAYVEAHQDSTLNTTYATVYVKNGEAVLDNVFINDIPIADYVEK
jgi:uncharacterized membrane-anchored protein